VKTVRSGGPFSERPYFTDHEIEQTATRELLEAGLMPTSPAAVRVDRFVEKRFNVGGVQFEELPDGVLGLTRFSKTGVDAIIAARVLSDEATAVAERRINSTIAHEAGHALLHSHLFFLDAFPRSLFGGRDVSPTKVLCRDIAQRSVAARSHRTCWWEYQANSMMGALLVPRALTMTCVQRLIVERRPFGRGTLPRQARRRAALLVADTFDVNPRLAAFRLDKLYPQSHTP